MWDYSSEYYYFNLLVDFLALLLLIIGIKYYKFVKDLRIFIVYSVLSLIQGLLVLFVMNFDSEGKVTGSLIENSLNIFMVLEFSLFYIFLFRIIKSKIFKLVMAFLVVTYLFIVIQTWLSSNIFQNNPNKLTVIESFFILVPILFYFIELFVYPPSKDLIKDPPFWIITGMFLLFASIIPLFLFKDQILLHFSYAYTKLYIINFFSYTILFGCFLNAFKCQIRNLKLSSSSFQ